jgi:hemolysin III
LNPLDPEPGALPVRARAARALGCDAGEAFNILTHVAALALAIAGGAILIGQASIHGHMAKVVGAIFFATATSTLFCASVLCHWTRGARKAFWERSDHASIYLLIIGTYTPFALMAPPSTLQFVMSMALWIAAGAGIRHAMRADATAPPPLGFYLLLGWLAVLGAAPVAARLPSAALAWLLAGALSYSAGTLFYRNRRGRAHAHGVWHLFVLAGAASHYRAIAIMLASPPP